MRKIGIFGGSFDPPHNGHVDAVMIARQFYNFDKIIVVPAFCSPFKDNDDRARHRMEMTCLAFPGIEINPHEMNQMQRNYTIDTMKYFKQTMPSTDLFLIAGNKTIPEMGQWHRIHDLMKICSVVSVPIREDVCSTDIRDKIKAFGLESCRDLMPKSVSDYIKEHDIYG